MKYGTTDIKNLFYGTTEIKNAYFGTTRVYTSATVSSIDPIADITIANGGTPNLPSKVTCTMSDSSTQDKAVTWTQPTGYSNTTAGTYAFTGDVADTDLTATVNVIVV
jgi:hypothetical protein